jgi:hypothetical protein
MNDTNDTSASAPETDPGINSNEIFAALCSGFADDDIRPRKNAAGVEVPYVSREAIQNRLDDVAGPLNWKVEYSNGDHALRCRLSVMLVDDYWLARDAVTPFPTGWDDSGEVAFALAAASFGIGRYLLAEVAAPAGEQQQAAPQQSPQQQQQRQQPPPQRQGQGQGSPRSQPPQQQQRHTQNGYRAPQQQQRQQPQQQQQRRSMGEPQAPPQQQQSGNNDDGPYGSVPRYAHQLFAWCKSMEQRHNLGVIKYLDGWAKLQGGYPTEYRKFNEQQVYAAVEEVIRKIEEITGFPVPNHAPAFGTDISTPAGALEHLLAIAKKKLMDRIWTLAEKSQPPPINEAAFYAAFDLLHQSTPGRIANLVLCRDLDLIGAYVAEADLLLTVGKRESAA